NLGIAHRLAVVLAVIATKSGGDGWESNPPRTPQQRPANGFEDRGRHQPPIIPSPSSLRVSPLQRSGLEILETWPPLMLGQRENAAYEHREPSESRGLD